MDVVNLSPEPDSRLSLRFEPYYELPMGMSELRALMQSRLGSHALPIEHGRFARPAVPRHLFGSQSWLRKLDCALSAFSSYTAAD